MIDRARHSKRPALGAFIDNEAAAGFLLIGAAIAAIIVANSGLGEAYRHLLHLPIGPVLAAKLGAMTLHLWINDGLMAIFFLFVGLEIKRELFAGQLSTWRQRRLPVLAAASGMIVPALFYLVVVAGRPDLARGWAIPAATDIAFALGVLALLGPRVPISLKLFLTAVAIVDDMGAVAIIALAYTKNIDPMALGAAALVILALAGLGKMGIRSLWLYLILSAGLWYAILLSGVHAAIAGVVAAAMIPAKATVGRSGVEDPPLVRLEHALSPIVAFVILPLFGFANAGLDLGGNFMATMLAPLPLGIAAGLFAGKQIGIFGAVFGATRLGFAEKLHGASWQQIYGLSLLCGIGFTMSLFIGVLAFAEQPSLVEEAKGGVLMGSLLSAIAGYAVLRLAPEHSDPGLCAAESDQRSDKDSADGAALI